MKELVAESGFTERVLQEAAKGLVAKKRRGGKNGPLEWSLLPPRKYEAGHDPLNPLKACKGGGRLTPRSTRQRGVWRLWPRLVPARRVEEPQRRRNPFACY